MNSLKKRTAPAPPPASNSFYGTLPHAPRHSQNFDSNDVRSINCKNHNQSIDVVYSTLPHLRSADNHSSQRSLGGLGGYLCDSKSYDRFEPHHNAKFDKTSQDPGGGASHIMHMTTFGHKRSPSGESLNRNIHLAGAKLVLPPAGEIPTLKHVDKSVARPKIPPPGPPPLGKTQNFS